MELLAILRCLFDRRLIEAFDLDSRLDVPPAFIDVDFIHLTFLLLPPVSIYLAVAILQLPDSLWRQCEGAVVRLDSPSTYRGCPMLSEQDG